MAKIVILGGGESGWGSAYLAKKMGLNPILSDGGILSPKYRSLLEQEQIPFHEGGHIKSELEGAEQVIKSPGIPESAPIVVWLKEQGAQIISEIEFASKYDSAKRISITGSNGKTTTTTLIHQIMVHAGFDVAVGGNIGDSYAYQVAASPRQWRVLELSSFQLDGVVDFRSDVALLLNVTPDHLDRYDGSMAKYRASKFRIAKNMTTSNLFIYSGDDGGVVDYINENSSCFGMRLAPFSVNDKSKCAYFDRGAESLVINCDKKSLVVEVAKLKVRGLHNYSNIMAAALATLEAGVEPSKIAEAIYNFSGVEHRLEHIATCDDIEYINDSKATNVDALWYALESATRPTILVMGGTDKGNDYSQVDSLVEQKVKSIVCMGVDNSKLLKHFSATPIYDCLSLEQAVEKIFELAQSGDSVLLSPACASFDLFKNYEDRGTQFKKAIISKLAEKGEYHG